MKKLKKKKSHVVKNEWRRAEKRITLGQNMYHTEMRFESHIEEIRITGGCHVGRKQEPHRNEIRIILGGK